MDYFLKCEIVYRAWVDSGSICFRDTSQLISKLTTWDDRGRAIKQFNNETAGEIAAISVEVTDAQGFRHVCPNGGAVYADKGYGMNPVKTHSSGKTVMMRSSRRTI